MARSIHADAVRTHPLVAWVIVRDQIDYPGDLVARLVTDVLTPYVLLANTLACTPNYRLAWCARSGSRLTRRKLWKPGSRRPLSRGRRLGCCCRAAMSSQTTPAAGAVDATRLVHPSSLPLRTISR
jgi:hypothetical protein